ncbi:entericidin A/B family lipoprotein [Gluconacetobacter sp. Hr-1-5]|uniref:entericidin A/B family lipoprotein n=1 Tax=Gluconacetobacter sp. Hr-1-5 TaxID=3395370 RepID=UPI003B5294E5
MDHSHFPTSGIARTALLVVGMLGLSAGLSACNTVRGAGQDVSSVGHNVSRGASASQNAITRSTGASER